eukprot:9480458-Pyramimonas_sp.AAC.1
MSCRGHCGDHPGPPDCEDLIQEVQCLLGKFQRQSSEGFRTPANDGGWPSPGPPLDRIDPAWAARTWGRLKSKFQVVGATGLAGGEPFQLEQTRLSELSATGRAPCQARANH